MSTADCVSRYLGASLTGRSTLFYVYIIGDSDGNHSSSIHLVAASLRELPNVACTYDAKETNPWAGVMSRYGAIVTYRTTVYTTTTNLAGGRHCTRQTYVGNVKNSMFLEVFPRKPSICCFYGKSK